MTILSALTSAHARMVERGEVPTVGYARVQIGWMISLNADGTRAGLPIDLRQGLGKKLRAPVISVPAPPRRTSGIDPCLLWDKTAYVLGITTGAGKRTAAEHAAWRAMHLRVLADATDLGLAAMRRWIDANQACEWPIEMLDGNVVFCLESERLDRCIHDRPAATALVAQMAADDPMPDGICLVHGERGPIARLHPAIKGVWGAQSSGAAMVSNNAESSCSYGHEQGDNAPIGATAAADYSSALNRMLERDSRNRIQIGDATVAYWADAADAAVAEITEAAFAEFLGTTTGIDEAQQSAKVGAILAKIRAGRPIAEVDPGLAEGVQFFVLGLAPNNARLAVRYWLEDDFGVIATNLARHADAMRIDPSPRDENPSIWRCLIEIAVLRKTENIQPLIAGEWLRAILTGTPYPGTLVTAVLGRIRADQDVNATRCAILRAVTKTNGGNIPLSLDTTNTEAGYLLGRLFATLEYIQGAALNGSVNATIRDKYYATASSTPRAVFPTLQRMATHWIAKIRKEKPGFAVMLDRRIAEIFDLADPNRLMRPTLPTAQQALFAIGYYHQRSHLYAKREAPISEGT